MTLKHLKTFVYPVMVTSPQKPFTLPNLHLRRENWELLFLPGSVPLTFLVR